MATTAKRSLKINPIESFPAKAPGIGEACGSSTAAKSTPPDSIEVLVAPGLKQG
jgi:hypothetical protein